jgi:hypothetical protein
MNCQPSRALSFPPSLAAPHPQPALGRERITGPHHNFVIMHSDIVTNVPPSALFSLNQTSASPSLSSSCCSQGAQGFLRFVFKSKHYPDQVATAHCGSPLQETDQKIVKAVSDQYPFVNSSSSLIHPSVSPTTATSGGPRRQITPCGKTWLKRLLPILRDLDADLSGASSSGARSRDPGAFSCCC